MKPTQEKSVIWGNLDVLSIINLYIYIFAFDTVDKNVFFCIFSSWILASTL